MLIVGALAPADAVAFAHSLHRSSPRRDAPFVCNLPPAGVPEQLLESELFGHAPHAFVGAFREMPGRIERAGTGTLFIDRLDLLPARVLARLEQAMLTGWTHRMGAERHSYPVECRVICASPSIQTFAGAGLVAPPVA